MNLKFVTSVQQAHGQEVLHEIGLIRLTKSRCC